MPQAIIEPDLAEWESGDYEGRLSSDIRATRPGWTIFEDGCPGGESPEQVSARADRVIARLRLIEGTVAIFTHGHFGRVLGARWIGLSVAYARHLLFDTASISLLKYRDRSAWAAGDRQVEWVKESCSLADTFTACGRTTRLIKVLFVANSRYSIVYPSPTCFMTLPASMTSGVAMKAVRES